MTAKAKTSPAGRSLAVEVGRGPGNRGFTLVELLVVLLIMGLVVTLTPVAFDRLLPGTQQKANAENLAVALRQARSSAIRANQDQVVIVDVADHWYRIGADGDQEVIDGDIKVHLQTAEVERLGETQGAIRFFADGTSTGGRVWLDGEKRDYFVYVDWLTGRVEIRETPHDWDQVEGLYAS